MNAFVKFDKKQNYFSHLLHSVIRAVKTFNNCHFVIFKIDCRDNLRRDQS